jgi:hypothetical protein
MVKYIEVKEGIFVKACAIEAIIDTFDDPEILCKVYTVNNSFPSALPSSVILEVLDMPEEVEPPKDDRDSEVQEQMLKIMQQQSNFAG